MRLLCYLYTNSLTYCLNFSLSYTNTVSVLVCVSECMRGKTLLFISGLMYLKYGHTWGTYKHSWIISMRMHHCPFVISMTIHISNELLVMDPIIINGHTLHSCLAHEWAVMFIAWLSQHSCNNILIMGMPIIGVTWPRHECRGRLYSEHWIWT